MPLLKIETNVELDKVGAEAFAARASALAAGLLGKPEQYVMVVVEGGHAVCFAGTHEPAASVTLKSIGLRRDACAGFSRDLCDFLKAELAIPPARVYIEFVDLARDMFGWNGGTF